MTEQDLAFYGSILGPMAGMFLYSFYRWTMTAGNSFR